MKISLDSLELVSALLESQDIAEALGTCDEYMDADGFCTVCTAFQELDQQIEEMRGHEDLGR